MASESNQSNPFRSARVLIVGLTTTIVVLVLALIAGNTVVIERFLRGAPFLAPLLYTNMGILGLLVLLETSETPIDKTNTV
jgi:hypothetical protein